MFSAYVVLIRKIGKCLVVSKYYCKPKYADSVKQGSSAYFHFMIHLKFLKMLHKICSRENFMPICIFCSSEITQHNIILCYTRKNRRLAYFAEFSLAVTMPQFHYAAMPKCSNSAMKQFRGAAMRNAATPQCRAI